MPVRGFIDSNGERVDFDAVRAGHGSFHTRFGHEAPRALLGALTKFYRDADHYGGEDVISVTTLIAPIQKTRLLQRWDVWVEWDANIWAAYGTIGHGFFEGGVRDGDIAEQKLVIEREGVQVGGTFDLLELTADRDTSFLYRGRDYKITSAYSVKKMVEREQREPGMGVYREKPDYFWQAQLYHLFTQDPDAQLVVEDKDDAGKVVGRHLEPWPLAGQVDLEDWALTCISRDWQERQHGGVIGQVEVVPIRLLELERVENYLNQRLLLYKASDLCDDAGLPECTAEETWNGKRCAKYCEPAAHCAQIHPNLRLRVDA